MMCLCQNYFTIIIIIAYIAHIVFVPLLKYQQQQQ